MSVKYDQGKRRPLLLPVVFVRAVQDVLEFGAKKYSVGGWRTVPDAKTRYTNALIRHCEEVMLGVQEGKGPFVRDEESGLLHLAHIGCNVAFLIWLESQEERTLTEAELQKMYVPYGYKVVGSEDPFERGEK